MEKPIPTKEQFDSILCKRSFFFFVQYFWDIIIPEEPVYNWHIPYICEQLQEIGERVAQRLPKTHDLIINVPPASTKSTIVTVMFPVWLWTIDPRIRNLTASYSSSLSTDHSIKSRDIIRSERFKSLFPNIEIKRDQDGKTQYKNTAGGERYATSVTGTVTGFHAHVLIVDDPLNPKEASSEVQRKNANDFMDLTLSTRKVDKALTPTIIVMQRLHQEDVTGYLLQRNDTYRHICLPAELSKDVNPPELAENYVDGLLDPKRLTKSMLKEMYTKLGSYGYAGQMQQTPSPEGGGIWRKWFNVIPDSEFPRELNRLGTDWDLAYTEKETNSASAFVTAGMLNEKMWITDLGWDWVEFPKLIPWMKLQRQPHYIESKASGKSAKQVLINQGIPAIEVNVTGGDKIARAQMASPYAESGMINIRQSLVNRLYNDPSQGILLFPNTHDDLNDALVQSINRLLAQHQTFVF